jgi:hypothetical protein
MKREWSIEAATQALTELRPLIALLRDQRAALEGLKQELLLPLMAYGRSPNIVAIVQMHNSPIQQAGSSITGGTKLLRWTSSSCSACASLRSDC